MQAFVGNSFLGNDANSPDNVSLSFSFQLKPIFSFFYIIFSLSMQITFWMQMDEESDVVAIDKKHYPRRISKFVVSGKLISLRSLLPQAVVNIFLT